MDSISSIQSLRSQDYSTFNVYTSISPIIKCIFAWSRARAEAQLSALEQLCVGAAHSEVKLCELAELRSRTERLESEGAQVESDHLREEETQLQGALCEVNLRVREAESSLGEANVHLEREDAELSRECDATRGRSFPYSYAFCCWLLLPSLLLRAPEDVFSGRWDQENSGGGESSS